MNNKEAVWDRVEEFRHKHLASQTDLLPVDVLTLAEIDLELDIIPFDGLFEKYGVDAAIKPDCKGLYVDEGAYVLWEKGAIWRQYRLRFSVAHELGHYVLHREKAEQQKFSSLEEFFQWARTNGGEKHPLEQTANEFAGRLLVPRGRLEDHFSRMVEEIDLVTPHWQTSIDSLQNFASSINRNYGVSTRVIEVRLEREGLWSIPNYRSGGI